MTTKNNIYKEHLNKWLKASKDKNQRGEIIRHICFVAGVHPKSIPRSFKRIQMRGFFEDEKRGRKEYYTPDVIAALRNVWDIAGEPCGENLHSILPEYVQILIRDHDWRYSQEATDKLLTMSLGTMKKRVALFSRQRFLTHGQSTTKQGTIHSLIPLRTGPWDEALVGTEQIDTVAHCGGSIAGDFIYTVNAVDVSTLWGSRRAQWNKGQTATVLSMKKINNDICFPVIEWHPDSGSEFINWHCKKWCEKHKQKLTRSRPNHKNDNCFVEERNGHIIRRWVGYTRLDAKEVVDALNAVYDVLTPYLNHFVASRRIITKKRISSRWKITREKQAKTPCQRILDHKNINKEVKIKLIQQHNILSPLALKCEIDRRLQIVFKLQEHHGKPKLRR